MNSNSLSRDNWHTGDATVPPQKVKGFFHGWILVITLTLVMTVVYGTSFSFSVFLKPLSEWFGGTRASISGAFAMSLWVSGLLAVLTGALTDKYGPRRVVAIGGFLGGLGYLLISRLGALWHLYAGFAVIAMNTSTTWTPIIATVSRWFTNKRVLALGIVTAGIGLGQMLMPPLAAYLIEANGWRTAYIVLAVLIWVIVIPAAIPARHSPQDMGLLPDGANPKSNAIRQDEHASTMETTEWSFPEAARTVTFWLLMALNIVLAATLFMAGIHIVAYATDVGVAATSAALILIFMGGANILSKVIAGGIAARYGSKVTTLLFLVCVVISLFAFTVTRDLRVFFIVAALFGFGFGGCAPPLASMVAEFFGLRSVGVIMGVVGIAWAAGCALGTFMGDYIFDISGSYVMAFLVSGVIAMAGAVLVLLLRAPAKAQKTY